MTTPKRKRRSSSTTPEQLLDTAEKLLGEHGIEGVSLRQICSAAGTANHYAVQYHFGDLQGLLRAITAKRMPEIEAARAQLLQQAKRSDTIDDTRTLLEIVHRPLVEHTNPDGERLYPRFILAALQSPIARNTTAEDVLHVMPIAAHVIDLLGNKFPDMPRSVFLERQRLIALMLLNSIFNNVSDSQTGNTTKALLMENALDMATGALHAPVTKEVSSILSD